MPINKNQIINSNLTNWTTSGDLVIQYSEKDTKTINLNNINAKEFTVLCQGGVVRVIIKIPNFSLSGSRYFYAGASNGSDTVYCVCKVSDGILSYVSIQKQGIEQTDGHMRVLY